MLYALTAVILIAWVLNSAAKKLTLKHLNYQRKFSKSIVEIGETSELITTVENHGIMPVTFLQITDQIPEEIMILSNNKETRTFDSLYGTVTTFLLSYQKMTRKYRIICSKRGCVRLNNATLAAGDLLGLNTASRDIELCQEIIVLPRAADLQNDLKPFGDYYGDITVKRWIIEDPVLTIGVREYTGREPLKSIHWLSSLRANRLMVKNYDYTIDSKAEIVINVECSKPAFNGIMEDKIEQCLSIARALVEQFESACIPYGIVTNAFYSGEHYDNCIKAIGHGAAHCNSILEGLGRISFHIKEAFEELLADLKHDSSTAYIIVTPSVLEPYIDKISEFYKNAASVTLIALDDTNLDYLPQDMLKFVKREK